MFDGQIGALQVGIVFSTFLFGITTAQTYLYYLLFPNDSKWLKWTVGITWLLELGHSVSALHALYFYTVINFGNLDVPTMKVPLSIAINFIISEVVFVFVQGYYIIRIYQFSHKWYMATICFVLLVIRFVGAAIATVQSALMTSLPQFTHDWEWDLLFTLSLGTFLDLAIPCVLVYYLALKRSSAYDTTLAIVDKLILWTMETGLLTGLFALLILIFFRTLPGKFAWMAVYMNLPKMFSNSLLANLNSRVKLRAMQENSDVVELSPSDLDNRNTLHFPHRLGAIINVTAQRTKTTEDFAPDSYSGRVPIPQMSAKDIEGYEEDGDGNSVTNSQVDRTKIRSVIDITTPGSNRF